MRMTRQDCIDKYGPIDFTAGVWPNQSRFMTMFEVPKGFFPDWHVEGHSSPVGHIFINQDCKFALQKALEAVHVAGLGHLLKTFDGCFNIRRTRGSTLISAHAYGLALDINAEENPLGATSGGFYDHPEFVKCWTDAGWFWGGDFHGRTDSMHFTWPGF